MIIFIVLFVRSCDFFFQTDCVKPYFHYVVITILHHFVKYFKIELDVQKRENVSETEVLFYFCYMDLMNDTLKTIIINGF